MGCKRAHDNFFWRGRETKNNDAKVVQTEPGLVQGEWSVREAVCRAPGSIANQQPVRQSHHRAETSVKTATAETSVKAATEEDQDKAAPAGQPGQLVGWRATIQGQPQGQRPPQCRQHVPGGLARRGCALLRQQVQTAEARQEPTALLGLKKNAASPPPLPAITLPAARLPSSPARWTCAGAP